jgi:preprotein translocase subunit SecG
MLHTLLIVVHVIICLVLSVVVLLQSSKGGGLAGAFGGAGGAPQQLLGSRGMTSLLHKVTIYCAVGFFVTSFMLFMTETSGRPSSSSIIGDAVREGEITAPATADPFAIPAESPAETPATPSGDEAEQSTEGN